MDMITLQLDIRDASYVEEYKGQIGGSGGSGDIHKDIRCQATTKPNSQCTKSALYGLEFCSIHRSLKEKIKTRMVEEQE
jgi:hypothetical protein